MRFFLIQTFKIEAVVSLPYDAFRPFTSTKTCILYATKRTSEEVNAFNDTLKKHGGDEKLDRSHTTLEKVLMELGWADEPIFMAEPAFVGYKRRKNLADLGLPNFLYQEDAQGEIKAVDSENPTTVLDFYNTGPGHQPDEKLGFWTNLRNVTQRKGLRFDPKYRWLWDYQHGSVHGEPKKSVPLSSFLRLVELPKISKGELSQETPLVDLEYVESRQALVRNDVPIVDIIGSDKVKFENCHLLFSKLEPYLGKIIIHPDPDNIGSTEWVGLQVTTNLPHSVAAYLLMLPEMCEAYRRLQSGKRHARFDPKELLDLKVEMPDVSILPELEIAILDKRNSIIHNRRKEGEIRSSIDALFRH
jgi:type I restriction enzyme M protein